MKISDLYENEESKKIVWVQKHCKASKDGHPIPASDIKIDPNGDIHAACSLYLRRCIELPYQFGYVFGFNISESSLKTMKHFPKKAVMVTSENNNFTSLEGITPDADEYVISENGIVSLKDVNKHIRRANKIFISSPIKSDILSLLKIDGLEHVSYFTESFVTKPPNLKNALEIINKYLKLEVPVNAKIVKAQRELIDADLDDFAEM